jgi:hypothetical protein
VAETGQLPTTGRAATNGRDKQERDKQERDKHESTPAAKRRGQGQALEEDKDKLWERTRTSSGRATKSGTLQRVGVSVRKRMWRCGRADGFASTTTSDRQRLC